MKFHKKFGLNPSMLCCEFCGDEFAIAILGDSVKEEAPRRIHDGSICSACQKVLDDGGTIILECEKEEDNSPRTGKMWGIKKGVMTPGIFKITPEMAKQIGLYEGDEMKKPGVESGITS